MTASLLEIGVEHLPARFVPDTLAQMEASAKARLAENNIAFTSVRAFGSFRKLALIIEGLPEKSSDIEKEVKGPPAKLLKDAAGNFTPQSAGFAQKNGITPEKLAVVETPNGPFIYAKIKIKGTAVKKLLPQIFTNIVKGLQFPKTMTWEESGLRFGRPIRTLIGLYGDAVVNFETAGVKSGRVTWPLSSFGTKGIKINSPETYVETLKNQPQPILIEPAEREASLASAVNKEARLRGLTAVIDPELLKETVFMTEHPVAVPGEFEIRFLTLPKELIVTVLKKQTKMFYTVNKDGGIEPYFIAVRDGVSDNQPEVMEGFKKVMSARLSDAVFFYNQDLKKGLAHFKDKLKTVQFIEGLGTMHDKTERTQKLALWLAGKCGADAETVSRAAEFAYADLTSSVVYEFPELQGYMGGVYAAKENFTPGAAKAVAEFYLPLTASSELPSSLEAAIVSIAGKTDAVVGNFAVGQIPTGSEDPFALRRQAMGVVRMLADFNIGVSVRELIGQSVKLYGGKAENILKPLADFFEARTANLLEQKGFDKGVIGAAAGRVDKPLPEILAVAAALSALKDNAELAAVAESAKRVLNIIKKAQFTPEPVSEKYLEHPAEKVLFEKISQTRKFFEEYSGKILKEKDCAGMFSLLAELKTPLADFFNAVMVNAENAAVRNNRLSLLSQTAALLTGMADITRLN